MADLRRAFGLSTGLPAQHEQVAVSMIECDVLQMATDILQTELQTPGVQRAQDLIQHVLDASNGEGDSYGPMGG